MNPETLRILDSIARDRNIDRELLIEDLEQAMVSAARKHFNSLDTEEFGCQMDRLSGAIRLWRNVEGEGIEEIPLAAMGRIPAQTAKQVMIQRFREDERNSLLEEFAKRQGEVVTGAAQRYEAEHWSCRSIGPRVSCREASRSRENSSIRVTASAA
jgi:N utilization substance protein A